MFDIACMCIVSMIALIFQELLFINGVRIPFADCRQHVKPKVLLTENNHFDLNINEGFPFKPGFAMAPFSSVGEPWPLPKHIKQKETELLHLQSTFKLSVVKGKSCDILMKAVERYKNIINKCTTEEHYNFPFNFNEETYNNHTSYTEQKYQSVAKMPDLEIHVKSDHCGYPHLKMSETYKLDLRQSSAKLAAEEVWGALRGLETFSQLLFRKQNTNNVYAKVTEIEDAPRFPHRGVLLDTARHFIYKNTIKQVLDGMTFNKLNVLHWHIVDDNSFPYKSEVFPKLSEKAAFHPTLVYTRSDITEIVEYARYRGIRIIPEFDTPGHTFAWFAYPEIVSDCYQGNETLGPLGPLNPAKNETYEFMVKLLSEVLEIFPDTFVHLGADEVRSSCWLTNLGIKSFLQRHADISQAEASSQSFYISRTLSYYFNRLIPLLKAKAKEKKQERTFILWEDVVANNNKIPSHSVLQLWFGNVENLNLLGCPVIYSKCWYLDRHKTFHWFDLYNCEPSPYNTTEEEKGKILGGEVCLWTEYVSTDSVMTTLCRGLPTGQISGPDYCLRPKDRNTENMANHYRPAKSMEGVSIRSGTFNVKVSENKRVKYTVPLNNSLPAVPLFISVFCLLVWTFVRRRITKSKSMRYFRF